MDRRLPAASTPFVGRAAEVSAVIDLITRSDVRILTLTGPAGVGKTRLAVEVARGAEESRVIGGALFVPLADVHDVGGVVPAILQRAGGADLGPRPPLDLLTERLQDREILLILDTVEHVIDVAPDMAELVSRCRQLTVLATSRHPLGLLAEHCFPVEPLTVPDAGTVGLDEALANGSVALMAARLAALDARFGLRREEVPAVVGICRRLEGVPLALELAAARARAMTLPAILEALESGFSVLTGGHRDQPARQRTMSNAIAWSYDLLDAPSAALFRWLSVCAGGCTLETVQALGAHLNLSRVALLDVLEQLVDHSLVQRDAPVTGRYRMLDIVREFAADRLVSTGDAIDARRRHAHHFLVVAERTAPALTGPDQVRALDELQREAPNLSTAIRWAVEASEVHVALRLCLSLRMLWYVRGSIAEGRALFAAALAVPGGAPELRARALVEASALARHHGDLAAAREFVTEALDIARQTDNRELLASALLQHGFILHLDGGYEMARVSLEESLRLSQEAGNALGTARALHHLGLVAYLGDGDAALAWELQCRTLSLFRDIGNERHIAATLIAMIEVARARGRLRAARELLVEAVEHVVSVRDTPLLVYLLRNAAALAADENRLSRAVRLLGAAEGLERSSGAAPWPAVESGAARWLPLAERSLGARRVAGVREAGRGLDTPETTALALSFDDDAPDVLSRREREIAELISAGLTNRAIGNRLFISERTVDGHVAHILAKLQYTSRAQIAARVAVEHDAGR